MQNRIAGPLAFIHIIDIFREAGQIDYTEVRAARRPPVRRGFAKIIETCPNEHTGKKIVFLDQLPTFGMG